jgi:hypothetical protein
MGKQLEFKAGTGINITASGSDNSVTIASTVAPSHFKGEYTSLTALRAVEGSAGDYAYVDEGADKDITTYIWDTTDAAWVEQRGVTTAETSASVKEKYEANEDTNAFTNNEKTKLSGIATGAEVNQNALASIAVGSVTVTANGKTDTFTLVAGTGVLVTANATAKTITFTADVDTILTDAITSVKVGSTVLGS